MHPNSKKFSIPDISQEEKLISEAIIDARRVQEYLWRDASLIRGEFDPEIWSKVFYKRVAKIAAISREDPNYKNELRKRVLQQAALSILALRLLGDSDDNSYCETKDEGLLRNSVLSRLSEMIFDMNKALNLLLQVRELKMFDEIFKEGEKSSIAEMIKKIEERNDFTVQLQKVF